MATLALNLTPNVMNAIPVNTSVGTSLVIAPTNVAQLILRSNATVAMTDTLPNPAVNTYFMPNGWFVRIKNIDASAAITVTPTLPATINGTTSISIAAAAAVTIATDGTNYWTC